MSFFGLPQEPAHNSKLPGFSSVPDHFAGLSSKPTGGGLDDDEGCVFEVSWRGEGNY